MAKNIVPFSIELAEQIYNSPKEFPVDFDDAFQWWEAKIQSGKNQGKTVRRDNLMRQFLLSGDFEKGVDYIDDSPKNRGKTDSEDASADRRGRPSRKLYLTIECFKLFGMQIAGNRGREIRRYFLDCERKAKAIGSRRLSDQEIARLCVLSFPTIHVRRFEQIYYENLSRLTGLQQHGHKRPRWWGQLTKEWVYDCLPKGVTDALYLCREEHGGWDKLHQYLSEDGLQIFQRHMEDLLRMMEYAGDRSTMFGGCSIES